MSAIYHKTMQTRIGEFDNAAAVTLMSADTERIMYALRQMHEVWANLIEVGLATWLLYTQVGLTCFAPLVIAAGKFNFKFDMSATDSFMQLVVLLQSGLAPKQTFNNASGWLSYKSEWVSKLYIPERYIISSQTISYNSSHFLSDKRSQDAGFDGKDFPNNSRTKTYGTTISESLSTSRGFYSFLR